MFSLVEFIKWIFSNGNSLDSLSGGKTRAKFNALNVPNFRSGTNEDSLDLQVKSLRYVFYRVQLQSICPFLVWDDSIGEYTLDHYPSDHQQSNVLMTPKLDKVYNIDGFKTQLINDPHRVLVDWSKNKAKSMFIISDEPQSVTIPDLNTTNFKFVILKANSSDQVYIDTLVNQSGLYAEHRVPLKVRTQCVMKSLNKQRQRCNNEQFTNDDRSEIIDGYLNRLAIHVQVHRLYNAKLRTKEKERANLKFETIGSYKSMKGSASNLGDCSDTTTSSFLGHLFTNDEKSLWWDQSLMAVRIRIEKERYSI